MKISVVAMTLALAVAGATSAVAENVKFEGCVVSQFGGNCKMIIPATGAAYMVNSAAGIPLSPQRIRLTGTAVTGPTMCGVQALTNVKWKKVKKKGC
jgi:hypothetical protein